MIKKLKLDGLFDGISLVPEDGIVLRYPVGDLVGSHEGFKYGKIDGKFDEKYMIVEGRLYPIVKS